MARRVFFSFHYQRDIWRVSQVRNSWLTQQGESNRFLDAAAWESIKRKGNDAVKSWIDRQLDGTGVTIVLIGSHTCQRRYVRYEIEESCRRGNGILGIYINRIKDRDGYISAKGRNPLELVKVVRKTPWWNFISDTEEKRLSEIFRTYDWVKEDGRSNIGIWIEQAAQLVGR